MMIALRYWEILELGNWEIEVFKGLCQNRK
jgi:hypothetical protein